MIPPRAISALLLLAALMPAGLGHAQDAVPADPAPATPPVEQEAQPQPALIMRDLLVLHADRYGTTANDPQVIRTTLTKPVKHSGRLKSVDAKRSFSNHPMPLGLIAFEGRIETPLRLRVELKNEDAQLHAHWPIDAISGTEKVEWPELHEAGDKQRPVPFINEDYWLEPLRASEDRIWLRGRNMLQGREPLNKERFLLYDASLPYQPTLALEPSDTGYRLKRTADADNTPPLTVLLHRLEAGWSAQALDGPWPNDAAAFDPKPAEDAEGKKLEQALAPIAELMDARGYNATEIGLTLGMIENAGIERSTMSLVYVLPEGAIDQHLLIRIKPKPDKIIRTTVVVVTNVDPDLGSQVKRLIADLSSERWIERDKAQRALIAMGKAAIKPVQELRNHEDAEVSFRAQLILDAYDHALEQD